MVAPTRTRAEQLALVDRLRAEDATLADLRLSRRALRHVLRPWLAAGWTGRDIEWALNHRPAGGLWPYAFQDSRQLRNPAGFVVHRLRQWTTGEADEPDRTGNGIPPGPCSRSAISISPTVETVTAVAAPEITAGYAATIRAAFGWTATPRRTYPTR